MTTTATVTPVIDYEPPVCALTPHRPFPPPPQAAHRPPAHRPPLVTSPALRAAGAFAEAALRRVLEVIDRRRPPAQLRGLLAAGLIDSLRLTRSLRGPAAGASMLRRVRLQPVGPDDAPTAAEVFASYTRGPRTRAIACRVEPVPTSPRWQVVALHIG